MRRKYFYLKEYKQLPKESGIYCIENLDNKKKYVGQSINLRGRIYQHYKELSDGVCKNDYLQNSWNLHGETRFVCFVLELCAAECLDDREKYYMEKMKSNRTQNGYNILLYGFSRRGLKLTEQEREHVKATRNPLRGRDHPFYGKYGKNAVLFGRKTGKTSAYFGVSSVIIRKKNKTYLRWQASININKKQVYIGRYKTEKEAAKSRDKYVIDNKLSDFPLNNVKKR